MKRKTVVLLLAVLSLHQAFTQTPPISNAELEARGTWVFWPYKSWSDGSGCNVESTLKFANSSGAARLADSISYFSAIGSSNSNPPTNEYDFCDLIDQDYVKGVLLVFGWNYLQYDPDPAKFGLPPTYGTNGNDLIQYQKFYEAIKAVVKIDNVKGYGIEIWTGHWAPIGISTNTNSPYWLSQAGVKRIKIGTFPDTRYFPDYLDKGLKVGNSYPNNAPNTYDGTYPNYVKIIDDNNPLTTEFTNPEYTNTNTNAVYKNEDYTTFGYMSDNLAETNYEYYYRNFLYRIIQYLCNLKSETGQQVANSWEDITTNKKIKEKLLFLQFPEGTTGDLRPWDGGGVIDESGGPFVNMDLDDDIDQETEWPIFVRKHWGWLANAMYKLNGEGAAASARPLPNVHLLLNGGSGSKVWGKKAADNNPGLNNLPRNVAVNFTKPSDEAYFLWPVSTSPLSNNNSYTNASRLIKNWFGKQSSNGTAWVPAPPALMNYMYQSWRKPPEGGHLYNMNFGKQYRDIYRKLKYDQLGSIANNTMGSNGGVIRYRDECDWNNTDLDNYKFEDRPHPKLDKPYEIEKLRKRPQHLFATATSALDFGIDYWIQYPDMLFFVTEAGVQDVDLDNAKVFTFFN